MDILQSFIDFAHNATTGELTESQKQSIEQESVSEYTPCSGATASLNPDCSKLLNQVTADVNAVSPDTRCVLNVPVMGCLAHSWGNLFLGVGGSLLVLWLLFNIIVYNPRRLL